MRTGRPSDYNASIAVAICERIALGTNLNQLCEDEAMPDRATVYRWLQVHDDFRDMYSRAREARADTRADKIDQLCRDMESGALDPNAGRVIIAAMQWQAGKEKPRRYGDKITQEHTGPNGNPLSDQLTEAELDKRLQQLLAKAGVSDVRNLSVTLDETEQHERGDKPLN